ncbi:hypothetical protein QR680_006879 [Steinernema hermaphroditum]|uniref:IMP2-like protein n=1 Tax=Steinernema hermaphroditum TaxID=289476 RepID=A0AA39HYB0_9BILA|nr:hypothetical protein QR680_006879 [Steinernema hermaphroditum]
MSRILRRIAAVSACAFAGLTAYGLHRTSTPYEDREFEAQFPELKKEFEWARQNTPWPGSRYAVFNRVYRASLHLLVSKEECIQQMRKLFDDKISEEDVQKLGSLWWYIELYQSPALMFRFGIGQCMSPTILNGSVLIQRRLVNPQQEVRVGDLVGYRIPIIGYLLDSAQKRVVAIGPATVYNGLKRCDEHVPKGKVYVMGDNRKVSFDSRYHGPVKLSALECKLVAVYQPGFKHDFTLVKDQPPQPKPQPQQSFGKTLLSCGACVLFLCALCHSSD